MICVFILGPKKYVAFFHTYSEELVKQIFCIFFGVLSQLCTMSMCLWSSNCNNIPCHSVIALEIQKKFVVYLEHILSIGAIGRNR